MDDAQKMLDGFVEYCRERLHIEQDLAAAFLEFYYPLARELADARAAQEGMLTIGVSGAQGSGKTTLALFLEFILERLGLRTALLSIDDLYLTWEERRRHRRGNPDNPYYRVSRGNPGTHNVTQGIELIETLAHAPDDAITPLPAFDKAARDGEGDAWPLADWPRFHGRPDVLILEGWCVGMRRLPPETMTQLLKNVPEAQAFAQEHDPTGQYGLEVNELLADYAPLFDRLDRLVFLKIPSLAKVLEWRTKQERELRERVGRGMTDEQVTAFIEPYMLLTGVHGLQVLGNCSAGSADIILEIGADQLPHRRINCRTL